jgi:hypothetical protein
MGTKLVHKLSSDNDSPFLVIGIASHENDYRISWALNSALDVNFIKTENLQVFNKKFNETQEFSMYISGTEESMPLFKLISNRCDNGFLLEDLRTIDFILLIENSDKLGDSTLLLQQLKGVPFVSTAFVLNPANIKGLSRIK